jgi:hypothetical protein
MSVQSKPLPNELLMEMINCVPLKIEIVRNESAVATDENDSLVYNSHISVLPTNASLLLTNSILTQYLRENTQKMLQLVSFFSLLSFIAI